MSDADRLRVIEIARSWIKTPFHDGACVKGVGVDCAHLLSVVYTEAGLVTAVDIKPYSPQFMLHRDQPLFEEYVRRFGHEVATPGLADIVLYRVGRSYAHGAIVSTPYPGAIIHAFKTYGFVAETGADEADLRGISRKFFSLW